MNSDSSDDIPDSLDPVLVGTVDISASGNGTRMLLGDLDGDGRMELVMKQPDGGIDDRYVHHEVQCLTAYDLEGQLLWQVVNPDPEIGGRGSDIPAQIHDIDGDGLPEVVCVMADQFRVLDSRTGGLKYAYDLPDPDAHDCIVICNLTGSDHPQDIILKNRYRKMWALDKDFNLLWTHEGNLGHFPWPHDFDADGCDEVITGYDFLDHDGKKLWSFKDLKDHADCIWVGNVVGNLESGDNIVLGGSVTVMYDWQGPEMWRYEGSPESQHVALGRFRKDSSEILVAGLDRIKRGRNGIDGMFLLSAGGENCGRKNGLLEAGSPLSIPCTTGMEAILTTSWLIAEAVDSCRACMMDMEIVSRRF